MNLFKTIKPLINIAFAAAISAGLLMGSGIQATTVRAKELERSSETAVVEVVSADAGRSIFAADATESGKGTSILVSENPVETNPTAYGARPAGKLNSYAFGNPAGCSSLPISDLPAKEMLANVQSALGDEYDLAERPQTYIWNGELGTMLNVQNDPYVFEFVFSGFQHPLTYRGDKVATIDEVQLYTPSDRENGVVNHEWNGFNFGKTGGNGFDIFLWNWITYHVEGNPMQYLVRWGETIETIAFDWKVSPEIIQEANQFTSEVQLSPGQTITLPAPVEQNWGDD